MCRVGGVRAVSRSVSKPARRNSFCFAAVRGRRRLGPGPRVCMGSVSSFGARRAPAFAFQELNEKFFGAAPNRRRLHAPVALAVPAIDSLALAQLLRRRDEVERRYQRRAARQGVAIVVLHGWARRLRPFAQTRTERPRQDVYQPSGIQSAREVQIANSLSLVCMREC